MRPQLLLVTEDAGPPQVLRQISHAGVQVKTFKADHRYEGLIDRIRAIGQRQMVFDFLADGLIVCHCVLPVFLHDAALLQRRSTFIGDTDWLANGIEWLAGSGFRDADYLQIREEVELIQLHRAWCILVDSELSLAIVFWWLCMVVCVDGSDIVFRNVCDALHEYIHE